MDLPNKEKERDKEQPELRATLTNQEQEALRGLGEENVVLILDHYGKLKALNPNLNVTLFFTAITMGLVNICHYFIHCGIDFKEASVRGRTYLMIALELKQFEIASLLVNCGANVDVRDKNGIHLMCFATLHEDTPASLIKDIIAAGAPVDVILSKEETELKLLTPLLGAVGRTFVDIVEIFLSLGAKANGIGGDSPPPLMIAVENVSYLSCLRLLLQAGADVNQVLFPYKYCNKLSNPFELRDNNVYTTLLHYALEKSNFEGAELLLKYGAKPNITAFGNLIPAQVLEIHGENYSDYVDGTSTMYKALLRNGSCYNPVVKNPLNKNIMQELSNPMKIIRTKVASLFKMSRQGNKKLIKVLVKEKRRGLGDFLSYINCINRNGNTLMAEALVFGHTEIAEEIMRLRLQLPDDII